MAITLETRRAYSEVDEFLSLLDEKTKNEIPRKLIEFFKEEKDKTYHKKIRQDIPIGEQNLKPETLAIIALLNLQYWCKDEEERKRLKKVYIDNERKYQEILKEKYNPNNIFKDNTNLNEKFKNTDSNKLIQYQKWNIKKFFYDILKFLHLK